MISILPKIKGFLQKEKTEALDALIEQGQFWKKNWNILVLDAVFILGSLFLVKFGFISSTPGIITLTIVLILYLLFSMIRRILLQVKSLTYYNLFNFFVEFIILILLILSLFSLMYMIPIKDSSIIGKNPPKVFLDFFYFSGVTFFSLGYGDLTPTGSYRLLSIFEVFIGVFIFTNFIAFGINIIYEKTNRAKWEPIKVKVTEELNQQFSSVLTDIAMICELREAMTFESQVTHEEVIKKDNEIVLNKIKTFAEQGGIKIGDHYKEHILKGSFGDLFKTREDFLNTFQIKYSGYLEPEVIIKLIDVQKAFNHIDGDIIIRNKQVDNNWSRLDDDNSVIARIESNFQVIVNGIQFMADKGILKYK